MGDAAAEEDHPFPLTDTDRYVLSLTDEQYVHHDWADLKNIIGECAKDELIVALVERYKKPRYRHRH